MKAPRLTLTRSQDRVSYRTAIRAMLEMLTSGGKALHEQWLVVATAQQCVYRDVGYSTGCARA